MSTHDLQVSLISLPLLKLTVSFRRWDAKKKKSLFWIFKNYYYDNIYVFIFEINN